MLDLDYGENLRSAYRSEGSVKETRLLHGRTRVAALPPAAEARSAIGTDGPAAAARPIAVTLLTGGGDRPYAFGITTSLTAEGASVDFIGSDDLESQELRSIPNVRFLNLRGDQSHAAPLATKTRRILSYYARLITYAATTRTSVFHILWNNKFEIFDRTVLMLYYRALGKKIVFTAHNVNAGKRDGNDSYLNRLTLRAQYRLADHIFVHTDQMKAELISEFGVTEEKVSVISLGINDTVARTALTSAEAKSSIGLRPDLKTILFFGRITPYKGLDTLIEALGELLEKDDNYRLIVAGRVDRADEYWQSIQDRMTRTKTSEKIIQRIEFISDDHLEIYFKAADVLVLPYTHVYQSGVLFLSYNFGLPVIATDVGSLREYIQNGTTGFICKPGDARELAQSINTYFASQLYRELETRRPQIRAHAMSHYSWSAIAEKTLGVYARLLDAS